MYDVLIIGGGAAGFYAALNIVETRPTTKIAILERGKQVLSKVRISGGGRCNVTHAEFDPKALAQYYPRGEKELLGPLHRHGSGDTVAFFEERGIPLKIEADGRMFPVGNSSETIVQFFLDRAERYGVEVLRHSAVTNLAQVQENSGDLYWEVTTIKGLYTAKKVLIATGSSPAMWKLLKDLGHRLVPPVPSLFTFNIKDKRITGIQGVSTHARVSLLKRRNAPEVTITLSSKIAEKTLLTTEGPLLFTHWGMSGPAILKLSAWGARTLNDYAYRFWIRVNWLPEYHKGAVLPLLMEIKKVESKKTVLRTKAVDIPRRLWTNLVRASGLDSGTTWANASKAQLEQLARQLCASEFLVTGKSTFKEEFVTAGGIPLREIDFRTMQSKVLPQLYFAGEVIDVDAITGGFNFQNAWTTGFIAAKGILGE